MMKIIQQGEVVEASHIGDFYIGMPKKKLFSMIGPVYRISHINETVSVENAKFWFDKRDKVRQIGVTKGFQGKFRDVIGIGSTLTDVLQYIGKYEEEYDTYEPVDTPGVCFELEDVDDWEELTAPIEWIFVYDSDF